MFILLADDERMVTMGLESMLTELYPNEHIYLYARNGKEVINQIKRQPPDIVFLDIKMPLMNGLEALSICKGLSENTVWIILSGYADFTYAQQALSLSAYAYILKPIDINSLKDIMEKIMKERRTSICQSKDLFSHQVIRSFNLADQLGEEHVDFQPHNDSLYQIYIFFIDKHQQDDQHKMKKDFYNSIDQFCGPDSHIQNYCIFFNLSGQLCFVCETTNTTALNTYIHSLCSRYPLKSVTVFHGCVKSIKEAFFLKQHIDSISPIRAIIGFQIPTDIALVDKIEKLDIKLNFCEIMEQLQIAYNEGNIGSYKQILSAMASDEDMQEVYETILPAFLSSYLSNTFDTEIQASSYNSFIDELTQLGESGRTSNPKITTDISKVEDFVYNHYMDDVSIAYVSECFNLSPTYLSKIFHQKTGQKYIDFVTGVRMEKAKKIIEDNPEITVKTVSENVGYTSVRHFSKTFQKYTGCLPSSWYDAVHPDSGKTE